MNLGEVACVGVDWIQPFQVWNEWWAFFEHGNEPSCSLKALNFETV